MKSSDPHKGEDIRIESYLDNGWIALVKNEQGEIGETMIGENDGSQFAYVFYNGQTFPEYLGNAQLKIKNVYIGETFYDIYLIPPCEGE